MALPFTRSLAARTSQADQIARREASQQEGFYREVDQALRQDQMRSAVSRYALPVGAAVGAALLALAAWLWWSNHQADIRASQGERIVLALDKIDNGQQDAAVAQLAPVVQDGTAGNRAAARMLSAGIAARQGKRDQAAQMFAQVAADTQAPRPFRDLAMVRSVALTFDKMAPPDVVARLRALAIPGAPFFGSAGELVGMAYLKEGHRDMAAPLFGAIAHDPSVPDSLRARARQFAGTLGFDAVDDVSRASAGDAAATPAPAAPASPAAAPPAPTGPTQ